MTHDITNAVSRFFAAVDHADWQAVNSLMTDPFHVDYSSYSGAEPADVSPTDLTANWAKILHFFDSVHHQIGNPIVEQDGNTAQVQCHGMATHFIANHPGGDVQFIVGTYDLPLIRRDDAWKLSGMRFNFKFASGNPTLADEARRRAAQSKETVNA